jgi:hypothetical protein
MKNILLILSLFLLISCDNTSQNKDTLTIIEKGTNIKYIIEYNPENVHVLLDDEVLIYAIDSTNIIKTK